jgi:hypothetical protein
MRHVLYLLRSSQALDLLPQSPATDTTVSVVLLHEAIGLTNIPVADVVVLKDESVQPPQTALYPLIGYADLVQRLFHADLVMTL